MWNSSKKPTPWVDRLGIDPDHLFPPQRELLEAGFLESDAHWLICAPTGAGKTLMGVWSMHQAILQGLKAAYIAPLRAIVEEKLPEWQRAYPEFKVGLFTGESTRNQSAGHPSEYDLLLFTPEKFAAYLQSWKRHMDWISRLGVLVIDEFHLLGDPGRGATQETLIGRLKRINPFLRIVALSATLTNAQELTHWLPARLSQSTWRPIPIQQRIVRFRKISEKLDLLFEEVQETFEQGGKTLVFVNSRRRSERVAEHLRELGLQADFNHAGLDRDHRLRTQQEMRAGKLDVVVATSTLEMGVNFPARKVVIYDAYGFDGDTFVPLSVQRYLQYSGRAGRPGYDTEGQSVLFLPTWDTRSPDYLSATPEPIRSALFQTDMQLKEILSEISGRLSISEAHLKTNFAQPSFWCYQDGQQNLTEIIQTLLKAKLIKASEDLPPYLSETALGRVASQMGMSPRTIQLLMHTFQTFPVITDVDLLIIGGLAEEATPKLGFNFEEMDSMADAVLSLQSHILDTDAKSIREQYAHLSEKRWLSAIKCAVLLYQHIQGDAIETLAERYDCYPLDIEVLKRNMAWFLETAQRIFNILWKEQARKELGEDTPTDPSQPEQTCQDLRMMVQYAVPREALGMVSIKGIGTQRARKLIHSGIYTPQALTETAPDRLERILHLKAAPVEKIVQSAKALLAQEAETDPFINLPPLRSQKVESGHNLFEVTSDIDPYRLRRALELKVDHASAETVHISGGTEPHIVNIVSDGKRTRSYQCDCADFEKGHANCKHIIRARLELRDDAEILDLLRQFQNTTDRPLRFALGDLWIRVAGLYDAFNGREVDYSGQVFLDRARARTRWNR